MENLLNIRMYKDGEDTIVVFKNTTPEIQSIIQSVVGSIYKEIVVPNEITGLDAVSEDNTPPSIDNAEDFTPDFLTEETSVVEENQETENQIENFADHIITMNGKYASAGLTIQQIYNENPGWIEFIVKRAKSAHPDVEKIKTFYKTKK